MRKVFLFLVAIALFTSCNQQQTESEKGKTAEISS
ncbi:MAG: lipoprotein [Porphyromonadaceae bacterium]|nr:lipoprotein [Porphyromonadaceae bacterium]